MMAQGQEKPRCWGGGRGGWVGGDCHQTRAGQQQAAYWGNSAAAAGLVSLLPASDEWRTEKKRKPTKVSLISMQLHFPPPWLTIE